MPYDYTPETTAEKVARYILIGSKVGLDYLNQKDAFEKEQQDRAMKQQELDAAYGEATPQEEAAAIPGRTPTGGLHRNVLPSLVRGSVEAGKLDVAKSEVARKVARDAGQQEWQKAVADARVGELGARAGKEQATGEYLTEKTKLAPGYLSVAQQNAASGSQRAGAAVTTAATGVSREGRLSRAADFTSRKKLLDSALAARIAGLKDDTEGQAMAFKDYMGAIDSLANVLNEPEPAVAGAPTIKLTGQPRKKYKPGSNPGGF